MNHEPEMLLDLRELSRDDIFHRVRDELRALNPGATLTLLLAHPPRGLLHRLQHELAGGFDWSPLEEGPALWRIRLDRRDPRSERGINSYLSWDHDRLDAILDRTCSLAAEGDWKAAAPQFSAFHHGLKRHIWIEEHLLFPVYEKHAGFDDGGPTEVMRDEHRQIEAFLADLVKAVHIGDISRLDRAVADLRRVLGDHNTKEEEVLYPITDQMVGSAGAAELLRQMQEVAP